MTALPGHPLVSIIIPAFNAEHWLRDALGSATGQTWQSVEVIVVDDGSVDDTPAVAESVSDSRVRVLHQSNRGAGAARNAGLRAARGDLIQFLDADDLLSPDKIELQVNALQVAESGSIASCAWRHFADIAEEMPQAEEPVWRIEDPMEWLVRSLSGGGMMQPAGWLTPRSLIDRAGYWNESLSLHDDGDFFARVLAHAKRNVFVDSATVWYRSVGHSLSRRRSIEAIESAYHVCLSRQNIIADRRADAAAKRAIATQFSQFVYEFTNDAPQLASRALATIKALDIEPANSVGGRVFRHVAKHFGFARAMRMRSLSSRFFH